jgi:hypothetical protein
MIKLTLTIFGIIIIFSISGQEINKFNYQISSGTSISIPYKKTIKTHPDFEGYPIVRSKSDISYFIEFILVTRLNSQLTFNTGVSYINSNLKVNSASSHIEKDGIIRTSYLGVPLEINYQVSENIPIRIGLGVYLNLLVKSEEKGTEFLDTTGISQLIPDSVLATLNLIREYNNNMTEEYNFFDFGLTAKVEYEFNLAENISMVLFSKFNYGLDKYAKNKNCI